MSQRMLRPADSEFYLPERPAPAQETAESLPPEWIVYFDSLSANEAAVLYKHDSDFSRRTDILLERRKKNGF
jgi:hypothetical protein